MRSSRKTPLFFFCSFKFEDFCYFKHCSNSALCCSFASPVFSTFTLLILQIVAYYIKQVVISTLTPQMLAQREFRPGLDSETTNVPACRWNPSSFCSFFILTDVFLLQVLQILSGPPSSWSSLSISTPPQMIQADTSGPDSLSQSLERDSAGPCS